MRKWPLVALGDHVDILTGFPFKSGHYVSEGGVRLLRGDNIVQGALRWDAAKRWPQHMTSEYEPYQLARGDLVLAMDRPWIEAGLKYAALGSRDLPCLLVQRVARLRAREGLDQRFLRYVIGSRGFTDHVLSVQTGTAVPHISASQIREYKFGLPSLSDQHAIAEVLGALDDKIELNSRVSQTADQLWQLYLESTVGSWDVNGDSLPAGWHRIPLLSLARFVNGRNFTKDATGTGRMVVRIAELNGGPGGSTVYNDIDVPDEHVAGPGDLLFAWSGSLTVRRWFRPKAVVNQHIFKVVPAPGFAMWFVHGHLLRLLPWFRQVAADKATTMGHIQRYHLDEPVLVPDKQTLRRLDAVCRPLWGRALAAERESLVLAELRDTLLPKLVLGELRVEDAEKRASAS
jgi:type I restriction enzyme S subunit